MKKLHFDELEWQNRFTYRKNVVFDEMTLRQPGAKFQIVKFAPKTNVAAHSHRDVVEIFYVLQGRGTFTFNGIANAAEPGAIFLCEPGDSHAIANDGDDELVILIFKTNEDPEDIRWMK